MNLRSIDLNLLVIFDALMAERHVTRAAMRIPMTQPAMSNALARLRHVFKDELFIRSGGTMEPTPRALELGEAVRQILRQTERLMTSDVAFDPATTEREFTGRMSDLTGYLLLPDMLAALASQAPKITLDILHMSPERTIKALETDQLDFAISMQLRHNNSICSEQLFEDQMVCVMRSDHPLAEKDLTLNDFLAADHLRVAMSPTDIRFVDNVLADHGFTRNVVAKVPHWLLVPAVLERSDLLAVISGKLVDKFASPGLVSKKLPFESEPFSWDIYWHKRNEGSAAHRWLRELIKFSCSDK
ncbi:transcriptional regulator [Pseudomonas sp. GM84]|uniref:LysR family transcriptional regulator n=1 Tax=Pseudomonas sp. GM84 TaxID=1144340 RepID=UPI00026F4CC6|nr:LysR family transcriptional regulator [Pseudomonas sp. GM84]EJN39644.1 transcriptional regulator [Pseudomonas sp. GM84]